MSASTELRNFPKGSRLGLYEIASSIGAGGMGEVFRARDTRLNRDVAVKVLPKDFVADADRLRRFEQEAKTLAALNHPNILTIHDAGVHEGAPYLVSELLEGKTFREVLNSTANAALPVRKATDTHCKSHKDWWQHTARESFIATSSRKTFSSPTTGACRFWISVWRS